MHDRLLTWNQDEDPASHRPLDGHTLYVGQLPIGHIYKTIFGTWHGDLILPHTTSIAPQATEQAAMDALEKIADEWTRKANLQARRPFEIYR